MKKKIEYNWMSNFFLVPQTKECGELMNLKNNRNENTDKN